MEFLDKIRYRDRNKGNYDVAFSLFLLSLHVGFAVGLGTKKERKVCYMKSFRVVPKRKEKEEAEEVAKNTGKGGEQQRRAEARLLL